MSGAQTGPVNLLKRASVFLRYRFFLFAGILPYLLGSAVAYHTTGSVDPLTLMVGLMGIVFVSLGIEGMNEYFDSKIGGDRVFESLERTRVGWHLPVGVAGFILALVVGLYLTYLKGWIVIAFALFGGIAALSYLIPPVHLCYRGFGETVIAVSYGPALTLGSFCLQTGYMSARCLLASMLPALLLFALAIANEIPDFYGDRLVGKRNLIVRMGRKNAAHIYGIALLVCFITITAGVAGGVFPQSLALALLSAPLAVIGWRWAVRNCEIPVRLVGVIRITILLYVLVNAIAILTHLISVPLPAGSPL